jgi:hypothetical protein
MASSSAAASGRRAPTGALAGAEKHDRRGVPPSPPCAACYTRGTRTTFAEIGHQVVVPAVIAPGPGKAVRKDAAFQILAKGLADEGLGGVVVTQAVELARAGELQPSLEVLGYGLVQPGRGSALLAVTVWLVSDRAVAHGWHRPGRQCCAC